MSSADQRRSPVSDASGEVQAGLLQVGLEGRLAGRRAAALGADVGGEGLVDALVSAGAAAVGEQDGGRALLARLEGCGEGRLAAWSREVGYRPYGVSRADSRCCTLG